MKSQVFSWKYWLYSGYRVLENIASSPILDLEPRLEDNKEIFWMQDSFKCGLLIIASCGVLIGMSSYIPA